ADPPSLELLQSLLAVRRPLPIFGLSTTRPDRRVRELSATVPPGIQRVLAIGELGERERLALAMARFGNDAGAQPLVAELLARSGGNPFYLRELVESLLERGVVTADGTRLRWIQPDAPLPVPTSVEAVVASR